LARAREILGLPAPAPVDPHYEEKQKLEAVRLELTYALDRVNDVLKSPARGAEAHSAAWPSSIPSAANPSLPSGARRIPADSVGTSFSSK
jgi:hypothetical protein